MVLSFVAAAAGCQMRAGGEGVVTPGGNGAVSEGADPEGRNEGDNIGDLKARLQRLRVKQAEISSNPEASFGVCEDLCSLAANICLVTE